MKYYKNKIIWLIKQLFPLDYYTTQIVEDCNGKRCEVVTWKMWFGRAYNIKAYEIKKQVQ